MRTSSCAPAGRRGRAADPLPRPGRPHPRAALRLHRQPRARGRDHVRGRRRGRSASVTPATVYRQEPERGGRPREMLQVGAELLGQGDLAADVEIVRLTARASSAQRACATSRSTSGHVGRPGARPRVAVDEPLRGGRAPVDRPQGPRQPLPRARDARRRRATLADPAVRDRTARRARAARVRGAPCRGAPASSTCSRSTPR